MTRPATEQPTPGRPPLPEGEARTAVMRLRMKPSGKARFEALAAALGKSPTEAHREAIAEYVKKHGRTQ